MLGKAILAVDDPAYHRCGPGVRVPGGCEGLGRKEKEKSERRQENLETLQTGSGAIAGIVVGGDATVGCMGRKGPGGS
jgi:hypothetical protein